MALNSLAIPSLAQVPSPATPPPSAPAAPPPGGAGAIPVIKAQTRLVLIDVVVRGKNDQPITGLKVTDFAVTEEGKPQRIKFFDAHTTPPTAAPSPPPFTLPPNQYTNLPLQADTGAPLTIILLDTLNTPILDQAYGRQQLLKFLKTLPTGQKAALFVLGTRLRVVQGFTGKTEDLVAAATKLSSRSSPLLNTEGEHQRDEDNLVTLENQLGGSSNAANLTDLLRQGLADEEALRIDQRVGITLDGLTLLARSVSGYPGRKNLLWLSGGFPFSLSPNFDLSDPLRNLRNYAPAVHEVAGYLAESQVAVYPLDIRGLVTTGVDASSTGAGTIGLNRRGGSRYGSMLSRQSQDLNDSHATMNDIAEQTGGEAFYNTNGLQIAMNKTMQHTAAYYTIAYAPDNSDWNGKFRRVNIKLDRRDAKLDYRRGYFARPEQEVAAKDSRRMLIGALQLGTPDATSLPFLMRIAPPAADHKTVQISLSIDPRHVFFTDLPNGRKRGVIDMVGIAWDKNGKDAGHFNATVETAMLPETYARVLRGGLPARQELDLKPGSYHLRVGVMDRSNQNIGTVEAPIIVP